MQVSHLHHVDAAAGQSGDALGRQCLHGNEGVLVIDHTPGIRGSASTRLRGGVIGGHSATGGSFLVEVGLEVFGEVVAAHESFWTLRTRELLLTCVCPLVALQFVRASEFLPTEGPAADEGSFSSVPAKVSSQVRCLTVHLPTTWHVTDMLLLLIGISRLSVLAEGTGAGFPSCPAVLRLRGRVSLLHDCAVIQTVSPCLQTLVSRCVRDGDWDSL